MSNCRVRPEGMATSLSKNIVGPCPAFRRPLHFYCTERYNEVKRGDQHVTQHQVYEGGRTGSPRVYGGEGEGTRPERPSRNTSAKNRRTNMRAMRAEQF